MITKYGYSTFGVIVAVVLVMIIIGIVVNNNWVKYPLIVFALFFLAFSINFFRDPDRSTPAGDNIIISPADGKVLFIKDVLDTRYINGKAKQISIFMSPLNVHVNRIPISGTVEYAKYHEGKFIAAFEDKASEENERSEFGINSSYGRIFFTQVAGFIARRIVYDLKTGDQVTAGERFGMIKFGSRVDVIVPPEWIEKVKKDDIVYAGETVLFEHPPLK